MDDKVLWQFSMRQAPKVFTFHYFKVFRLFFRSQMLQTAAAAFSVQRAKWFHAIGASFQNFDNTALGKVLFLERQTHLTDFARQGSRYKTHATIFQASHALAPLHHLFDAEREAFTTRFATRAAAVVIAVRAKAVIARTIVSAIV
jgi:hypothetical protein